MVIFTSEEFSLVLKTTSKNKRYNGVSQFCNPDKLVFFIPKSLQAGFKEDTYIQLNEIKKYTPKDLLRGSFNRTITEVSAINENIFNALLNCLRKIKDDIEEDYYELLFKSKKQS
ncbi:hypothetical protein [Leptospira levettii]|uniref:hypothetical protein n=1 Tax=Leptospira levettii TaxID=2023178 RepID=UPI00223E8C85|nr:hypothetical protein [Leptospira levettii]MCW7467791.1 hypothetical protein [Leptospira levettii]MCW7472608.1 hypothetical protein [Leptospira levettii]